MRARDVDRLFADGLERPLRELLQAGVVPCPQRELLEGARVFEGHGRLRAERAEELEVRVGEGALLPVQHPEHAERFAGLHRERNAEEGPKALAPHPLANVRREGHRPDRVQIDRPHGARRRDRCPGAGLGRHRHFEPRDDLGIHVTGPGRRRRGTGSPRRRPRHRGP